MMQLVEHHDFEQIKFLFKKVITDGDLDSSGSIIKVLKALSFVPQAEVVSESVQSLKEISRSLEDILIQKRKVLPDDQYKKIINLLQESSVSIASQIELKKKPAEFLRTGEVAQKLGVTTETVRNMIEDGRIKAEKIGTQWKVPADQFESLDHFEVVARKLHQKYNVTDEDLDDL